MKSDDVAVFLLIGVVVILGSAVSYWYEFKFKPQRYAEEFIKVQQSVQEKSK